MKGQVVKSSCNKGSNGQKNSDRGRRRSDGLDAMKVDQVRQRRGHKRLGGVDRMGGGNAKVESIGGGQSLYGGEEGRGGVGGVGKG